VVEGERPLTPLCLLLSRSEEDNEEEDSLRRLRAFFDFSAFFFGTFDLDLDERADALFAGMADLSFSLATPSDSESDDIDSEPSFATAAAADAPGAVDAAAAAEDVPGLMMTPSVSYWIGTSGSSSVGPSVAASVASCS
jgi:hypothetical protein